MKSSNYLSVDNTGKNFYSSTIGFDQYLSTIDEFNKLINKTKQSSYPPYNILMIDEYNYLIEIAVAGFTSSEIDIEYNNSTVTVSGSKNTAEEKKYLHHGLATRNFTRTFKLAETVIVKDATMKDGILTILLERLVPDTQKPRKISIN